MFIITDRVQTAWVHVGQHTTEIYSDKEKFELGLDRESLWYVVATGDGVWTAPMDDGIISIVVYRIRRLAIVVRTNNVSKVPLHYERLMIAMRDLIMNAAIDAKFEFYTRFVGDHVACQARSLDPIKFFEVAIDVLPF